MVCFFTSDGLFSSGWEEVWLVLWGDSVLAWYRDQQVAGAGIRGGLRLGDSPDLIAAGQHTARLPDRPRLPPGVSLNQVEVLTHLSVDVFQMITPPLFLTPLCLRAGQGVIASNCVRNSVKNVQPSFDNPLSIV